MWNGSGGSRPFERASIVVEGKTQSALFCLKETGK